MLDSVHDAVSWDPGEVARVLTDAELLLGLSRHMSAYGISAAHAAFETLLDAGRVYEMAWRLRESQASSATRVRAIAFDAKIGTRQFERDVLPVLEQLVWVRANRDSNNQLLTIDAIIPPPAELIASAGRVLDMLITSAVERAALVILRATSRQPLEKPAALEAASSCGEEAAEDALRHLAAVGLVRQVTGDDGRVAVFNPNIWVGDAEVTTAALRTEDARVRTEVGALLEEVAAHPGLPEVHVESTEQRWIDFAVAQGLVQRSVVQTSDGSEQPFLFSPHLNRDAFGATPTDPSGHVRQLVGSMIYASTFASWKLRRPGAFLYALIRDEVAGDVPEIGRDYPMLETAGTIQVIPGTRSGSFSMRLLQADVAEQALAILDTRGRSEGASAESGAALGDQRTYSHLERERARLASEAAFDDVDARRLVDALRDVSARRPF